MKQKPIRAGAYDPAKIEKKWQKKWDSSKLYASKESATKQKAYILDMFPYPSGEGLHVGHPKGYIATDVVSRMKRMQGMNVLHPMGFDAFGLPAENYAIKTKTHPEVAVKKNVARFKEQLEKIGLDYDWSREVNTTDPKYYKWTQWIFLQLWKKGLAYESFEPINWCPSCKTGLANEDVEDGRCERCGTPVEKKPLRQWVLRITDYAERLLHDLDAKKIPMFVDQTGTSKPREGVPWVERKANISIIEHWSEKKYMCLAWKKVPWITLQTGGIEEGESPVDAALREIREETGYKDLEFMANLGQEEARFYHNPKQVNRRGFFNILHFKLKDAARDEVSAEEQDNHEILWVPRDEVMDKLTSEGQKYAFQRLLEHEKGITQDLLDWPEAIKESQRNWIGRSEGAEIDFRLTITDQARKPRFVILHGYKESPTGQFFPWLKKEFEKLGHEVQIPELPNPADPKEGEQVDYVLKNCKLDENTVIIGHSLGGTLAMKVLMKLNKPISGMLIVAAAHDPNFGEGWKPRSFHKTFSWDIDYERVMKLAGGKVAVLSDTREENRAPYLKHLAKGLGAGLIEVESVEKHFTAVQEPAVLECCTPTVKVFTTRPDTIFGVTYVVLAPEHMWVGEFMDRLENRAEVEAYVSRAKNESAIERTDATKEKTGVELKGIKAVNPATGEEVPVWISDYVLADYGTGAVMAVPAHDDRDYAFAKKYKLPIKQVVAEYNENSTDLIPRKDKKTVAREIVQVILKNKNGDKYALIDQKEFGELSLISGGIEKGESAVEAAQREVLEETGYKNTKPIPSDGNEHEVHSFFFAKHKDENRYMKARGVILQLIDDEQSAISEHEKAKQEVVWLEEGVARSSLKRVNQQHIWDHCMRPYPHTGSGKLVDSASFTGKDSQSVMKEITTFAGGRWVTKYKLRDWVFSRQRYWGEPIPLIHCEKCGVVAVPEKDLPVELPKVKSYEPTGTGESPLAAIDKWVNVKCPQCRGKGKRETNTMPQWAGSCWYYLRYEDPKNSKQLVDPTKEKYWSPVDLYVGGAEHATRHLIYARFWHKFLYDIGVVSTIEPFAKLQSVGLIMGEDGRKMSKRFGNVVNPDDVIATYGADTLRIYEMFMGPFDQQISWSTSSMVGARRFIERIWKLAEKASADAAPQRVIHKTVKKITDDIAGLRFNTAISSLMICANELDKASTIARGDYEALLSLLAPFAPHATEELWSALGNKKSIHIAPWPAYDPALVVENTATIMFQVNGKVRGSFTSHTNATKEELETAAKQLPEAVKWLNGKEIKRVIVIPGKLVNIVV